MTDKELAEKWCSDNGYEFIKLSPNGRNIVFYESDEDSENYEHSVLCIDAIKD